MRLSVGSRMTFSQILRLGLFLGASVLAAAVFLFTHQMVTRLSKEVATTSRVLARFCAQASFPATTDPEMRRIFSEVIAHIDFPIVITDVQGLPRAWRETEVDAAMVPAASIDSLAAGQEIAPVIQERIETVRARAAALDRRNRPIPMTSQGTNISLGMVHYGEPPVLELLRLMPLLSSLGVVLLIGIGLWGLAVIRHGEKQTIWVGLAKETAHQLGTPLSSLMGWNELLRERAVGVPEGDDVRVPAADFEEAVREMQRDLERLNKVAQRFSHVGSAPRLRLLEVAPVVREVVAYMKRRAPGRRVEVDLRERYEDVPAVPLNPELLAWALENMIANALSALDKQPGLVEVTVRPAGRHKIEIEVRDNGRGMTPQERRRIFEPGYTTKRRGWGLGLALARRVVHEYHSGRLFVRETTPGRGTAMVIELRA